MLDTLRQNTKSVLTYVLFGIIIVVFVVSFGPGSKGCSDVRMSGQSWAARVNGETLTGTDFDRQFSLLFRVYQGRVGQGLTRELAQQIGLRKMAMDQIVDRELVLQAAGRAGIAVSDEELEKAIVDTPSFHVGGRFDRDYYRQAVSAEYGNEGRYEQALRRDLMARKAVALLRGTVQVSEEDVREAWEAESDQVALELVRFPLAAIRDEEKPSPAQLKEVEARQKERIAAFYKENAARFDRKKRVQARHILVRADERGPPDVDAAARQKVEGALERARKGEDFAVVARAVSEDPGSKDKGGDLGWFGPGMMARPFEEAAFGAAKGALLGPVRTRFGWHAIQVTDVAEPEVVSLEKATPEVARELAQDDLARQRAERRAGEALAQARKAKGLSDLFPPETAPDARKAPAPVKWGNQVLRPEDTGPFGPSSRPAIPRLGPQEELFAAALAAAGPGPLGKVYATPGGPVIAWVKERRRPEPAQFAGRRGEVQQRLLARREEQLEQAFVKNLRERGQVEVNEAWVRGEAITSPVQLD